MDIVIVPMALEHLDFIWEIEQKAHSHPWKKSMIRELNSRCAIHHTLLCDDQVVGYFYAQNVVGEVTLLNIAIASHQQGKGFGKQLLQFLIDYSEKQQAESIWLEVRESNTVAQNLYRTLDFNEIDRRINYYPTSNGKEDAIIMSCNLATFSFS